VQEEAVLPENNWRGGCHLRQQLEKEQVHQEGVRLGGSNLRFQGFNFHVQQLKTETMQGSR
jgi:hypothetical protein